MTPKMRDTPPLGPIVGGVVLLAGVVAGTSHGSAWAAPREGVADTGILLAIVGGAFALCFAVAGGLVAWRRRAGDLTWGRVAPVAVVAVVMLSLAGIANTDLRLEAPVPGVERAESDGGRLGRRLLMDWRGSAVRNAEEAQGGAELWPASVQRARFVRLLLLVVVAAGLALVLRGQRASRGSPSGLGGDSLDARARAAVHGAIVSTIDAMLADADPRTAIIGAYARLLEELEGIGVARKHYEGPREHLYRVLSGLDVRPAPLRRLITLFEVARFSEHSLTSDHREEALAALREVAESLAVVSFA